MNEWVVAGFFFFAGCFLFILGFILFAISVLAGKAIYKKWRNK